MKKLLILAVIGLVALTIVPAALAGNGPGGGGGTGPGTGTCPTGTCPTGTCPTGTCPGPQAGGAQYSVNGTVTAVDSSSLSVVVKSGKSAGKAVVLNVTATTLLYKRNADGTLVTVTLAAFVASDRVTSVGTVDLTVPANPVFTAYRVTLLPPAGTCPGCPN